MSHPSIFPKFPLEKASQSTKKLASQSQTARGALRLLPQAKFVFLKERVTTYFRGVLRPATCKIGTGSIFVRQLFFDLAHGEYPFAVAIGGNKKRG